MGITAVAVGKKHEDWVRPGIQRYAQRMRRHHEITWKLLPHSQREGDAAREEESDRILKALKPQDFVVLLDERGSSLTSPQLAAALQKQFDTGKNVVMVIGGAYGVSAELQKRADLVWSLSGLVFPHQLVRLIIAEQIYRAQEISAGRPYHHE
ncbi:23S rRNA (pseudouridine(1915)-N(3))-methyltransferase RlmH [Nesterenkonia sp. NBAIMH1]|uniref:23S rRNA (pseudouridine(1915)-N(3))-methyltransferase RlmH n=1 Tax=Nesterenkonia sp. NBAIMH1 TaxID=2600320 RepID=UPI0011B4C1B5|nr:23S rRNA (pseudouridine(1915)-N(3))-methyltransferase RlmH [Nesterenkonia sp. NBAIMH1]